MTYKVISILVQQKKKSSQLIQLILLKGLDASNHLKHYRSWPYNQSNILFF